jgi:hypothetical protein
MLTGASWFILKGIQHTQNRLRELEKELTTSAAAISEADERILYTTIGMALTTWARMEEALVLLVEILLRSRPGKAGLIMYSIINFNVWLTLITDLYELEPRLIAFKPRWNKISERIRRIKDLRDRLAHESAESAATRLTPSETVLRPSDFDVRQKSKSFKPLAVPEITAFSEQVGAITKDVIALNRDMLTTLQASAQKS